LQKYLYGVFELPLPRNARKLTKKNPRKKKSAGGGGGVWDLANVQGVRRFAFGFWRPLDLHVLVFVLARLLSISYEPVGCIGLVILAVASPGCVYSLYNHQLLQLQIGTWYLELWNLSPAATNNQAPI
jgi:hypothetical protein